MNDETVRTEKVSNPKKDFRYILGWVYLQLSGWQVAGKPPSLSKFVVVGAPHTSNWDLPLLLAIAFFFGLRVSWMGKHTLFRGPFDAIFRWLGGIPIERQSSHGAVEQMIEEFQKRDRLILVLAPEGTRRRVESWKSGFYHIAVGAGVPILIGFIDYGRNKGGIGPLIDPSGDIEADMAKIRNFFATVTPRHPERFGPVIIK
ncbi:MAG: lysophospholipid acyltransferase family protein [Deltaproteobacteria bacterium]|nr:lysophospholipid acyltransferase family protein [Deltaproteobacteria bacterium]